MPMYFRGAVAAVLVYDITSEESFQNVQSWVKELRQSGPDSIILAVAGNKRDRQKERKVSGRISLKGSVPSEAHK